MIYLQLLKSFLIIGAGTFGGGGSGIMMIEHEVVAVHGWITSAELSELITVAQMTPGAVGVNAATYTGFKVAGIWGAVAATIGFTLPSVVICFALIRLIAKAGGVSWMDALRKSVRPAVAGLIIAAVFTYGRSAVTGAPTAIIAALTFAVLAASGEKVHPILLILGGGIAGAFI